LKSSEKTLKLPNVEKLQKWPIVKSF